MKNLLKNVTGIFLLLFVWVAIELIFNIPGRYLPSPQSVIQAAANMPYTLAIDILATAARILTALVLGISFGIFGALFLHRVKLLKWLMPSFNALRAVPPIALIPFFLLWFGFSEFGRILLLTLGLGINVLVASADIIQFPREQDRILFRSFDLSSDRMTLAWWYPRILESILPTLRFGVATAIGVVVVAEMLGSQVGLGYLIQTSYSTFALDVIVLASVMLGVLTTLFDNILIWTWGRIVFWRK